MVQILLNSAPLLTSKITLSPVFIEPQSKACLLKDAPQIFMISPYNHDNTSTAITPIAVASDLPLFSRKIFYNFNATQKQTSVATVLSCDACDACGGGCRTEAAQGTMTPQNISLLT